jgi:hypothetical protein
MKTLDGTAHRAKIALLRGCEYTGEYTDDKEGL